MNPTNPNWTDTRSKPMTDIEQILKRRAFYHGVWQGMIAGIIFFGILAAIVFFSCKAHASTNRVVDFSWTYDTTVTDLKGFNIYMDDKEIASIPDPKVRQYTHTFNILNDANTCFTMKAFDIAGQPSPMSPQVCIDAPPPGFESFSAKERPARATGGTGTNTITKPNGPVVAPVK